jgi:hypothetical protein
MPSDEEAFPLGVLTQLNLCLPDVARRYYRLALLVGPVGSGKTPLLKELHRKQDIPYLNLGLTLSQRLLDLPSSERPLRVHRVLADIIDEQPADTIAIDNIELLFDPSLRHDPLTCLQGLSRNKMLVVAWPGRYRRNVLVCAEPGHPEYRHYERPDAMVIALP